MFSGIVESTGKVRSVEEKGSNKIFAIDHSFKEDLYIDQSISHNGVCLTVISIEGKSYKVAAIKETLTRSNLAALKPGDEVNLERSLTMSSRIDGHIVQGHVDMMGQIDSIKDHQGSWEFRIALPGEKMLYVIEKGSVAIDGISLTVSSVHKDGFSVSIIPYTYEHTILKDKKVGDPVNIEFDSLGKYVIQYLQKIKP